MTIHEAEQMIIDAYSNYSLPEENKIQLIEALEFLIKETHAPVHITHLGSVHYGDKRFDLALKYYELAASYDYAIAYQCLGYIWYYGRCGTIDYKKAYECYCKAAELGDTVAEYKIGDMYKNGYYVEQNYEKHCEIVEKVYERIKDKDIFNEPISSVFLRMARIRKGQGKTEASIELLMKAKEALRKYFVYSPDFYEVENMRCIIEELYGLIPCDMQDLNIFDLLYVLKTPCNVSFYYEDKRYEVESSEENGYMTVRFGDKWYRSIKEFFEGAKIGDDLLVTLSYELYNFEVKQ